MRGKRLEAARMVGHGGRTGMDLEELARLAETTAEAVAAYVEQGLLGEEVRRGGANLFGEGELYLVRRIEQLRLEYGVSSHAAGMILDLAARVEELESEIRNLREALGR
ncbi:MAG: MerR family transcriptional regulator [Verrucomicrobia bacterium]|nr:MerR family transcriptional regulator [Verrucomicrobiota bacterium]